MVIVSLIAIPFLIGGVLSSGFPFILGPWWGLWFGGALSVIILAYFLLAEALYSRRLGKQVMGFRVERIDGRHVDFWSASVRNLSKINFILLIFDLAVGLGMHAEMSQKWSNRYVGTKVEAIARMTIIS